MSAPAGGVPAWRRRFKAARVSLPTWALDATDRLAYATNASGVWQVMSWDLAYDRHTQLTDKPTGVRGGQPLPDGTGVVWFDDGAGDEVGRYVVTPFHGGGQKPLAPGLPDGWSAGLSLRPQRTAIGVSVREGVRIAVLEGGEEPREIYAHALPADVGGLSRDARLLAIAHSEHGDVLHPAVRVLDATNGDEIGEQWDGEGRAVSPGGWSPVAGDARLVVLADHTGRTLPEIWDLASGVRTPLALDLEGEVWVADWWPDASALLLGQDHLGRTSLHRHDLATGRTESLDLTSGTISAARVRDDGAIWYAFTSSATPTQVRVRDAPGARPKDRALLTPPGEPAPEGRAYTSLHYDNGAGDRVHAFLATPEGQGPFPLLVDVHGGPQAHDEDSFAPGVQAWVDHGFAVLLANYRGSTGYGKAWQDLLIGNPGRPEVADVTAGRDHLVALGVADPDRAVLHGGSWGGYVALLGIGIEPDAWSAAVAIVPVADYVAAFDDESPVLQELDRTLFGGGPADRPELWRDRSPITHVDAVRVPVLVITGANDTRCPRRQVDNYIAALAERGIPHHYDVFEAGHGSLAIEESIRQTALAIDFVAEHLGTPPAQR